MWRFSVGVLVCGGLSLLLLLQKLSISEDDFFDFRVDNTKNLQQVFATYKQYHEDVVKGEAPFRVLIYDCSTNSEYCGGLGDRLRGLATALVLSIASNRALLIHVDRPMPMETSLHPHHIAWNLTNSEPVEFVQYRMSNWINTLLQEQIVKTNFHPLSPEFLTFWENREEHPIYVLRTNIKRQKSRKALAAIFSTEKAVRVVLNNETPIPAANAARHFRNNGTVNNPALRALLKLLHRNEKKTMGMLLRYMFVPSSDVMMRLQALGLDVARQIETQTMSLHLKAVYERALRDSQTVVAFKNFTSMFYQEWTQLGRHAPGGPFRELINAMILRHNRNPFKIENLLGAHFRVGGSQPGFKDSATKNRATRIVSFRNVLVKYTVRRGIDSDKTMLIYLSDDATTRSKMRRMVHNVSFATPSQWDKGSFIIHLDKSKGVSRMQVLETFAEMLTLSMCDLLVVTKSNFGKMSWILPSKGKRHVTLLRPMK